MTNLNGDSSETKVPGVHGSHTANGPGVLAESAVGPGLHAISRGTDPNEQGVAILAEAIGTGVWGQSEQWVGVYGYSTSTTGGNGVLGEGKGGPAGVAGVADIGIGVLGITDSGEAAIRGEHKAAGFAGFFEGKVGVTRDLNVNGNINVLGDVELIGADLAEQFTMSGEVPVEPGCVVILVGDDKVEVSSRAYDHRVAGVVSGAGSYRPGLVLDRRSEPSRTPLALNGKAWCLVDAGCGAVSVGDLLTTSATPGHAMRAADTSRSFGAVIGKALGPLDSGRALVPVLVGLG